MRFHDERAPIRKGCGTARRETWLARFLEVLGTKIKP